MIVHLSRQLVKSISRKFRTVQFAINRYRLGGRSISVGEVVNCSLACVVPFQRTSRYSFQFIIRKLVS